MGGCRVAELVQENHGPQRMHPVRAVLRPSSCTGNRVMVAFHNALEIQGQAHALSMPRRAVQAMSRTKSWPVPLTSCRLQVRTGPNPRPCNMQGSASTSVQALLHRQ